MLKFSADVKVNRPIEKVFAWLTNPDNQGKFVAKGTYTIREFTHQQ